MSRNLSGVYSLPVVYEATPGDTILSTQHNTPLEDIQDDLNTPRPVVAGGTGVDTEIEAWDVFAKKGNDIETAGTLNLQTATGPLIDLTGTTTVTAVTLSERSLRIARAASAFQLTASASLIVNGSASTNYTTTAGDLLIFQGYGSSVVRVWAISGTITAAQAALLTTFMKLTGTQTVTGGFRLTPYSLGSITTGTVTPDANNQNYQHYINNGAHTLAMPAYDCAIDILLQNGVTPGSITVDAGARIASGNTGDAYVTTDRASATCTISNATPGVVTYNSHGLKNNDPVYFTTTGTLPTGLTASTLYYARNVATNTFEVSATPEGSSIATSSAGSGTHTAKAPSQFIFSLRRLRGVATYVIKALQ